MRAGSRGGASYRLLGRGGLATDRLVAATGQRGIAVPATTDVDPPWLGLLGDRDGQGEHAVVVTGHDPFEVQAVTDDQLAGVGPDGTLSDQIDGILGYGRAPLSAHRQGVVRIIGIGENVDDATEDALAKLREYALQYLERLEFYRHTDRRDLYPLVVRFLATPEDEQAELLLEPETVETEPAVA